MQRAVTSSIVLFVAASSVVLGLSAAPAQAATSVGKTTLTTDTTWTAEAGPYTLTGPVTIPEGVTLTIEPGTALAGSDLTSFGAAPSYTPWFTVRGNLNVLGTEEAPVSIDTGTSTTRALIRGPLDTTAPATGRVTLDHVDLNTKYFTQWNASSRLAEVSMTDSIWRSPSDSLSTANLAGIAEVSLTRNAIFGGTYSASTLKFGAPESRVTLTGNRLRAAVISCEQGTVTMRENTLEAFPYRASAFNLRGGSGLRTVCPIDARDNYWESAGDLSNRIEDGNDSLGYAFADTSTRLSAPAPGTPTMPPAVIDNYIQVQALPTGLTAWLDVPSSDGGLPTASKMEAIAADTGLVEQTSEGSAWSAQFRNLDTSKSYFVRATRTNAKGTTTVMSSPAVTPVRTATVPGAPTSVQMSLGARSASFSWSPPASDGGTPITSYQSRIDGPNGAVDGGNQTWATFTDLVPGGKYTFSAWAVNDMGVGEKVDIAFTAATAPGRPRIGTARSGTSGGQINAVATWAAPLSNGGLAVSNYRITAYRMRSNGTVAGTRISPLLGPAVRAYRMVLPAKGKYRFAATAYNPTGPSQVSARSNLIYGR